MIILQLLLIATGVFYLTRSLFPIRTLILELPPGNLRKKWKILSVLIIFFMAGYGVFAYSFWQIRDIVRPISMIVSIMLLFGGIFVYLVADLSLKTMSDIKHLAILKHESVTDSLMGIKNRRYFEQRVMEEINLAKRYKLPLSIILLDVDHFKQVNDTYGHQVGDEVLINLARTIKCTIRDTDIVARYGGEEVVIITPNTGKKEAENLAERLREAIEKTTMATIPPAQEIVQVTISAGVCSLGTVILDKEALVEEADRALYLAKKYGRNRVVCSNW